MSNHINIEFKAKAKSVEKVRSFLMKNHSRHLGIDHQKDTYFNIQKEGRLKLREGNIENSLIFYRRENIQGAKQSDVNLVKLEANSGMREALRKSAGIKVVVDKKREIFFIENVKFHLDKVQGLGKFIEVEAIDTGGISKDKLIEQCDHYIEKFEIEKNDFIQVSYSDLIMSKGAEFKSMIYTKADDFLNNIFNKSLIDVNKFEMDHLCWRVESISEYEQFKDDFSLIGDLLIESKISNRMISTFCLYEPIQFQNHKIDIIELPQPKEGSFYSNGFEHLELVMAESFDDLINSSFIMSS